MLARARPEPACLPFLSFHVTLDADGANLQTTGLSHFFANVDFDFDALLLVISQRQLIGQPVRDWSRPVSKGQFPFPLEPEFWSSWNDSWLKTSSFAYDADVT
jgi:hypothetical protein